MANNEKLGSAREYYERGSDYRAKGDHDQAIADYSQSIQLDPRPVTYIGRGLSYMSRYLDMANGNTQGSQIDLDMAFADFNLVIQRAPQMAGGAYTGRGLLYYALKDYDQAIADFEAALQIDPNNPDARQYLEEARQTRGR